jgi:hypothetical protein
MIDVSEVVLDPDMIAPKPYTVERSTGTFELGGFVSVVTKFSMFGPVQQASNKEIAMLPEADRVGSVRSFWSTVPILLTRGFGPAPSIHGEVPQGALPGSTFVLSVQPPGGVGTFTINGLLQQPGVDYLVTGATITMLSGVTLAAGSVLFFQWPVTAKVQAAASDIIQYEQTQYRVLSVYRDPGSGYYKALGTQMQAS